MKRLLALLAVGLLTLNTVGCTSGTGVSVEEPSGNVEDVTTEITWWAYPTFASVDGIVGKYEQSLADAFNQKYPNITVNVEMLDFQNGPEKIITAIQGGTGPDVLFDAPGRIVDYGTSGYLVPLNDMVKETGLDKDTSQTILDACSDFDGNIWMYPTSAAPFIMAVSKTALEEAGLLDQIDTTTGNWTTEEFVALSKAMAAKGYKGVEIYAGGQGGDQGTRAFITNLTGATIMNSDRNSYTMDTDQGKAAFELVMEGINEGWLTPNTAGVANDALEHFTTPQNSTFWAVNLWSPGLDAGRRGELEASGVEAIPMNLPSVDGKPTLEYLVNGYGIFNNGNADKIAASKLFVEFLADDAVYGKQNVVQANCFPVRQSFGDLYVGNEKMAFYSNLAQYYGTYYNTVPGFASMRPFWWGSLQAMLTGDKTPSDAALYFNNNANETLDE